MKGLPHVLSLWSRKPPPVGATPADVVHTENKLRLLRYRRKAPATRTTPILLVPSLINRHYVLDLLPGKSFAEWLVARGFDVFCVDWGTPGDEDRFLTFDEICDGYLGRALRRTAQAADVRDVHVLGYCMGGILTTILAASKPDHVASLVTLATPVRFDGQDTLGHWTRSPSFDVRGLVNGFGNVPWPLLQSAFHMLRPTLTLAKLVHLLDRAWDDESLDGFLAIETWGNDNVAIPGAFYRRYIEDLYRGDALANGDFRLAGRPARLESIECPLLAVTFEHDNVVPWQAAKELVDRVSSKDKEWLHLPGGHVGAVVSKSASHKLWPKIAEFWEARDAEPSKSSKRPSGRPRGRNISLQSTR